MNKSLVVTCALLTFLTGCIPLKIPTSAKDAETEESRQESSFSEEKLNEIRLAPFYNREIVSEVIEEIIDLDEDIAIVDSRDLWKIVFPEYDLDVEVTLHQLLEVTSRDKMQSYGIEFLVFVELYIEEKESENWRFWPGETYEETTTCSWFVVPIKKDSEIDRYITRSKGKGRGAYAIWPFVFIALWPYTDPNTESKTIASLSMQIVERIREMKEEGSIKISVLAAQF